MCRYIKKDGEKAMMELLSQSASETLKKLLASHIKNHTDQFYILSLRK